MISLLCDGPVKIEADTICSYLNAADHGKIWRLSPKYEHDDPRANLPVLVFESSDPNPILLTLINPQMPLEEGLVTEALARSWWFDKKTDLKHNQEWYISLLGAAMEDQIRGARLISMLCAMLTGTNQNIKAVWNGYVGTLFSREQIDGFGNIAVNGEVPLMFWVYTAHHSVVDGKVSMTTGGLARFVGHEIEIWDAPHPAKVVNERLSGIMRYLLLKGPVILDGQIIGGEGDNFVIRCRFLDSRVERDKAVSCLHLEFLAPDQPTVAPAAAKKKGSGLGRIFGLKT